MDDNATAATRTVAQVHDGVGWIDVAVVENNNKINAAEALFEVMKSLNDIRSQNDEIMRMLVEDFVDDDDDDEDEDKPKHWLGYVFSFNALLIVCVLSSMIVLLFAK